MRHKRLKKAAHRPQAPGAPVDGWVVLLQPRETKDDSMLREGSDAEGNLALPFVMVEAEGDSFFEDLETVAIGHFHAKEGRHLSSGAC